MEKKSLMGFQYAVSSVWPRVAIATCSATTEPSRVSSADSPVLLSS